MNLFLNIIILFINFKFIHLKESIQFSDETPKYLQKCDYWLKNSMNKSTHEYQTFDGWYNNVIEPELGSTDSKLIRLLDANYKDGVLQPIDGTNPLELSKKFLKSDDDGYSYLGRNALQVFFGQFVVDEILDTRWKSCPPEYMNIDIPEDHEYYQLNYKKLPFIRSKYYPHTGQSINNPRELINSATGWIDGSAIYGTSKPWSDSIRSFKKGQLKNSSNGLPSFNDKLLPMKSNILHLINHTSKSLPLLSDLFSFGNIRGNENLYLKSINIVWFRWHNFIADLLHKKNPRWSDEKLFQEARKWVIASQQQIIINEWLPLYTGAKIPKYTGYKAKKNPSLSPLFGASMGYGHTLVPSFIAHVDSCKRIMEKDICNTYWKKWNYKLENILQGMLLTSAKKDDGKLSDLSLYGPLEFTKKDLGALLIQRGRDHGLPYFERVVNDLKIRNNTINKNNGSTEFIIGGLAESSIEKRMGSVFRKIINEQFERIRDSDRFWFQNKNNSLFTNSQIRHLESLSFAHILLSVTKLTDQNLQKNVFLLPNDLDNSPVCHPSSLIKFPCKQGTCYTLHVKHSNCSSLPTYDFIERNELYLILISASIFAFILVNFFILWLCVRIRIKRPRKKSSTIKNHEDLDIVYEWNGHNEDLNKVKLILAEEEKHIVLKSPGHAAKLVRRIDLSRTQIIQVETSINSDQNFLLMRFPNEHDLILKFYSTEKKNKFSIKFNNFLYEIGVGIENRQVDLKKMLKNAYTKHKRQKHLEEFFKAVFSYAFSINRTQQIDLKKAKQILSTELTQFEFAEILSLQVDSLFVQQMFSLVDTDSNGYISYREFIDMMVIFSKGSADQKAKLMFDIYDLDHTGTLSQDEFKMMIRSMLELANQSISHEQLDQLIITMFNSADLNFKYEMNLDDFLKLLGDYKNELGYLELNLEVSNKEKIELISNRRSAIYHAHNRVYRAYSLYLQQEQEIAYENLLHNKEMIVKEKKTNAFVRFMDQHKLHILWLTFYIFSVVAIFTQKAYYYLYLNEESGLRQNIGLGIAITRGSASVIMFTFTTILITMCRNTLTVLRETFLHRYIPFDSFVTFHKIVAFIAFLFSLIHSIGHFFNFYYISTQSIDELNCLFSALYFNSDQLPKLNYWCFKTVTGLSGIILLFLLCVIYIFALRYSRRYIYDIFWFTHSCYPLIYGLMFIHGLTGLIQPPILYKYITIPLIIFTCDKLISANRKKIELNVIRSVHYPSNVTMLELTKPMGFDYKSGQWVRIACLDLNSSEFHPFTIASAPHEDTLKLYIRSVGPFTENIRSVFNPTNDKPLPKLYLDGPYGEGHQDWFRYKVSILVGGGIGVTPFASILKDIAFKASIKSKFPCEKVFFLWITRTQKHFEWLVDIIAEVEKNDTNNLVCTHIFITQFYEKFDLRTMMLYICERHFQRLSNKSLFTGLKAKTQFGRPNFLKFFKTIKNFYRKISRIGVFSCGPPPMTESVQEACEQLNKNIGALFIHHYENF